MFCDSHLHIAECEDFVPAHFCCSCAHSKEEFFIQEEIALKSGGKVLCAFGLHPQKTLLENIDFLESLLVQKRILAVGETGLDYYKQFGDKRSQIELFITQLEIAQKFNLPVIIHNRDAGKDLYEILSERLPDKGAILHCYSEDEEFAKKCLDKNIWFSFAGNLTYRNARNLHNTVLNIPVERILIETESPFMIPSEFREKKRTMPAYLPATAKFLAEMLDMDLESLSDQLWKNSCKAFGLPEA